MDNPRSILDVGSELWLVETGGRLTFTQAVILATQGFSQTLRETFSTPKRIGQEESKRQFDRVGIAREEFLKVLETQRDRVLERQGESLLNHTARTYLLGAALLTDEAFGRVDHTVACVAALAHDDGLLHPSTPGNCFTGDSADEANIMLGTFGASRASIDTTRSAVISHFQPKLPAKAGAEAQLVALGASADVMGIGLKLIDRAILREVWEEWPDLGFIPAVRTLLKGERTRAPLTRPGALAISGMPYLLRSTKATRFNS
jgi:hypothetical protein